MPLIDASTSTRKTDSERLEHIRILGRFRAKKYYEKNKEAILAKKKEYWKRLKATEIIITPRPIIDNNQENIQLNFEEEEQPIYQDEPIFHEEPIQQIQPIISNELNYALVKEKLTNLDISNATKKKYIDDAKILMRLKKL